MILYGHNKFKRKKKLVKNLKKQNKDIKSIGDKNWLLFIKIRVKENNKLKN